MEDMQRRNHIHVIGGPEEEKTVKQNILNYSPSTVTKNRGKIVYLNLHYEDSAGTWGKLINFDIYSNKTIRYQRQNVIKVYRQKDQINSNRKLVTDF